MRVAEVLRDWIPLVVPEARPWFSPDDTHKGTLWQREITGTLARLGVGIVCLTPENIAAPWVLFEAGALSKGLDSTRVFTYLLELGPEDISGPLSMINHTRATEQDTLRLIIQLSTLLEPQNTNDAILARRFQSLWPDLQSELSIIPKPEQQVQAKRETGEMIVELLDYARNEDRNRIAIVDAFRQMMEQNEQLFGRLLSEQRMNAQESNALLIDRLKDLVRQNQHALEFYMKQSSDNEEQLKYPLMQVVAELHGLSSRIESLVARTESMTRSMESVLKRAGDPEILPDT